MKTNELKSLTQVISGVVSTPSTNQEVLQDLQEGFLNSLTEKACQVSSKAKEEEDEDEDDDEMEDEDEMPTSKKKKKMNEEKGSVKQLDAIMKRLADKARNRARRKAAKHGTKPSGDDAYAGMKPSALKYDADLRNPGAVAEEIELAEKAAPGYEDWASDPKVKASFKKQYGNRWKEVMYGRSWNMKKMNESEQLDEISDTLLFRARAKAKGVGKFKVRTNSSFAGSSKDVPLHKKITKELQNRGSVPLGEETELDEGYQAKRLRIMRKALGRRSLLSPKLDDYMKRSFKKKRQRDERISGGRGSAKAFEIRATKKKAAMQAEGLAEEWGGGFQSYQDAHREVQAGLRREASINRRKLVADIKAVHSGKMTPAAFTRKHKTKFSELPLAKKMAASRAKAKARYLAKKAAKASAPKADSAPSIMEAMQLDEAGYKRLMRLKKAAYKSGLMGSASHGKKMRAAAEREAQVGARMASRGGASTEAVKGGGSTIGKSGKPTMTAARLANQRDKGLARFRSTAKIARYSETGDFDGKLSKEAVAKKREMQKGMAKFRMDARHGDFGQEISPESKRTSMRARYNYEKKYGRLKGK